jgi:hypothetical protein
MVEVNDLHTNSQINIFTDNFKRQLSRIDEIPVMKGSSLLKMSTGIFLIL